MSCFRPEKGKEYIQGSTYSLDWKISKQVNNKPEYITDQDIETIEFNIGPIKKYYPEEVKYNADKNAFTVELTQEDTIALPPGEITRFARVKWKVGQVKCTKPTVDFVYKTNITKVL